MGRAARSCDGTAAYSLWSKKNARREERAFLFLVRKWRLMDDDKLAAETSDSSGDREMIGPRRELRNIERKRRSRLIR